MDQLDSDIDSKSKAGGDHTHPDVEEGNRSSMHSGSFIPKPSNFQQLQLLQEGNANSFSESAQNNSKSFFVAPRGASIGAESRSPPKTLIGAGIGQGFGYQRQLTSKPSNLPEVSHKHTNSSSNVISNVPVSQINLHSQHPPSLAP